MPKLPRVSGAEALKALQKLGFEKVRQSGGLGRIEHWAAQRQSRTVCICHAHSVVTATQDPGFADALR